MADLAELAELRTEVQNLVTLGVRDLQEVTRQLVDEPPEAVAAVLADLLGPMADPYAAEIGALTTEFYMADRSAQGVNSPLRPPSPVLPDPDRMADLARWGAAPLFTEIPNRALFLSRIAGGLIGALGDVQRDTTIRTAAEEPEQTYYQRVPQPGCCAFCGMLASRGAAYTSKTAANGVVGRGVPVSRTVGRRGGQGRGTRPRGSRGLGERYHDYCRCVGTAVHGENYQELGEAADRYFDAYTEARAKFDERVEYNFLHYMDEAGNRHVDTEWIDHDGTVLTKPERVLIAEMRKLMDSK